MRSFFMVVVEFSLVAKDITATLQDMGFGAPLVARTPDDALHLLATLANPADLRLAVVQAVPAQFATSSLARTLDAMGTRVLFLTEPTEPAPEGNVLPLPFFTDDLRRLAGPALDRPA